MLYSTTLVLAVLSVGQTLAGPTHAHLHRHRDVHAKRDVDWKALDWNNMGIDWTKAWEEGQAKATSTAVAAAAETAVADVVKVAAATTADTVTAATSAAASVSSSTSDIVATLWDDLVGMANDLTSFGEALIGSGSEVDAVGNIGSPQGSNMIKVASTSGYDFTNTFINTQDVAITVVLWNKAYSTDGTLAKATANSGSCVAPETPTLTIALAPGASQVVAFMDGTLMSFSQAVDGKSACGAFATTWGECSFKTAANGASGYDMSAIINPSGNNYWLQMSAEETDCVSDPTQNYWMAKNNNPLLPIPIGTSDGSCYVPGDKAHLTTKMGGYM